MSNIDWEMPSQITITLPIHGQLNTFDVSVAYDKPNDGLLLTTYLEHKNKVYENAARISGAMIEHSKNINHLDELIRTTADHLCKSMINSIYQKAGRKTPYPDWEAKVKQTSKPKSKKLFATKSTDYLWLDKRVDEIVKAAQ